PYSISICKTVENARRLQRAFRNPTRLTGIPVDILISGECRVYQERMRPVRRSVINSYHFLRASDSIADQTVFTKEPDTSHSSGMELPSGWSSFLCQLLKLLGNLRKESGVVFIAKLLG